METMNLDQYYQAFSGLLGEIKGVSHAKDIEIGYLSSNEFVRRYGLLLEKLSDEDLKAVAGPTQSNQIF